MIIFIILFLIVSVGLIIYYIRREEIEENESYLLGYRASTRQITESGNAVPYLIPKDAFEEGWNDGIKKHNESIERAAEH